ncbi:MAG: hypothetical protein V8Q42_09520 [Anaerovoracaceae bacterium]
MSLQSTGGSLVINATTDIDRLVDLIEAKTPERMPNYSADCCMSCCGTTAAV